MEVHAGMKRILLMGAAAVGAAAAQSIPANSPDFFEMKIRPVLVKNCYSCHTTSAMGGLRVDSGEALAKGAKRGAAIVPGDPENSMLIKAVRQSDPNLKMPIGSKLETSEIDDLAAWIKAGAVWPKSMAAAAPVAQDGKYVIHQEQKRFWSLVPLRQPKAPPVKEVKWAKTEIDRFVLARLEKEGLKPVPPASKRDLIRRATLDLTGLPPTYEEIQAFEKDVSPEAFAKVVDRLLASPHYGERWGRHWLDVARYAEDDYRTLNQNPRGYRPYPNAYMYRDWVVQAFNDDLPYDQFIRAQLAGDLADTRIRHKVLPATGFLGLGPWYYDNGAFEITRADERHDRVDAVTRGFMGLTVACARCHDHKYDPIPQTDYYSLAGVFYNTIYEEYPGAPKKIVDEYTRLEDALEKEQRILQEANQSLADSLSRSLAYQTSNYLMGVWELAQPGPPKREMAQIVEQRRLDFEVFDRWVRYMAKPTTKYKHKDAWQAMMKRTGVQQQEAKRLADAFQEEVLSAMLDKSDLDAENQVIRAKDFEGTKPKRRTDKPSNFTSYKDFNPGSFLLLKSLPDDRNNFWTEIFQRELRDAEDPNAMMAMGPRQMNPGVLLFRGWGLENRVGAEAQARLRAIQGNVESARKKLTDMRFPFVHGVKDAEAPADIQLSMRGDPNNPVGAPVPRHFLSLLSETAPEPFTKGSGRLELADAILRQPVTMRVIVNRAWKAHFGAGIVDTPSNFGVTGERPSNPDLLEYLASSFVAGGMSMKKLHREIMLSAVYQLGTANDAAAYAKDPGNRLHWRAEPKRLDAEQLRDSVLMAAGTLDTAMGGPSSELTPAYLRRTVYGKVSRYKLDEYLQLFDFPSPNLSAEKRFVTTVPLQRLFLMNSDFMQMQAEELARRVAGEADNRARIRKAYQYTFGRDATEEEIKLGIEYLSSEPLREYEERKNRPPERGPAGGRRRGPGGPGAPAQISSTAAPGGAPEGGDAAAAPPPITPAGVQAAAAAGAAGGFPGGFGMGMFGGMGRRGPGAPPPDVKYEVTVWGRYAKVLLSSSEFLFVN